MKDDLHRIVRRVEQSAMRGARRIGSPSVVHQVVRDDRPAAATIAKRASRASGGQSVIRQQLVVSRKPAGRRGKEQSLAHRRLDLAAGVSSSRRTSPARANVAR